MVHYKLEKIGLVERNKILEAGQSMMNEEINLKPIFWLEIDACYHWPYNSELEMFLLTQQFAPKSAKFESNGINDYPSGASAPPRGTIFYIISLNG